MRKILGAAAVAAALVVSSMGAQAADKLVLQLKWVTQAQFAGYYVAKDKGFYRRRRARRRRSSRADRTSIRAR